MKIIKINESQKNRLFEAYKDGFSFEQLSRLGIDDYDNDQYNYCTKWLGEPIGEGSSRCVFQLSDNIVLKLAYNMVDAGISQNELESQIYEHYKSPLLAKVYDSDDRFTYLVCEAVIPATEADFEKILGIPFYNEFASKTKDSRVHFDFVSGKLHNGPSTIGFDKYFDSPRDDRYDGASIYDILAYIESNYVLDKPYINEEIESIICKSKWLSELVDFVEASGMSDFCSIGNYGIVNRNGEPTLVILDAGMNLDVWKEHYGY